MAACELNALPLAVKMRLQATVAVAAAFDFLNHMFGP